MGILFGHVAVRRPARMADTHVAVERLLAEQLHQIGEFAHAPANIQIAVVIDGNAG
jgi:hypothetical protein